MVVQTSDSIKLPRCLHPGVNRRFKMTASTVKTMLHVSKVSKKRVVLKKHDDFKDSLCYIRVRNSIWVLSMALLGGLTLVKVYQCIQWYLEMPTYIHIRSMIASIYHQYDKCFSYQNGVAGNNVITYELQLLLHK